MKKITFPFYIASFVVLLSVFSCASRKDIVYLQDVDYSKNPSIETVVDSVHFTPPRFKPDDRLTISISSINPEAARPFNLPSASFNTGGISSSGQQQQQSYLVDKDGNISFPRFGKLKVEGKNRVELESYLEEIIRPFLVDVKANVQLVNFRVSIIGEVKTPGEYTMNRDKITIIQALALAGDLTIHGKRDKIKLLREVNGQLISYRIDVGSKDVINSPAYYLQQNDVLYVEPNKPKINAAISSPVNSYLISATGLLITIISLLTR